MAIIPWFKASEQATGAGHPTREDTINRPLKNILEQWGYDPEGTSFPVPQGPAGPQGVQGLTGATGPQGSPGLPGANGGSGIIAFPNDQSITDFGADSTGVADARTAFVSASAAIGGSGVGAVFGPGGVYRIASNLTITDALRADIGCRIRPDAGVVVTVNGPIGAGTSVEKLFDTSLGGSFNFRGNKYVSTYHAKWFMKGDATDETTELNSLAGCMPKGVEMVFSPGMNVAFTQWHIGPGKEGLKFRAATDVRQGGNDADYAKLTYAGAAGGVMVFIDSSTFIEVSGFHINSGDADVVFDLDGDSDVTGHIGSNCFVERNFMQNVNDRPNWVGVRISETSDSNHEYHEIRNNIIYGASGSVIDTSGTFVGCSMTTGSATLTVGSGSLSAAAVGARVRVSGAGTAGGVLVTTVAAYISPTQVTLADAAVTTVAGVRASISARVGTGIKQSSSNAHGTVLHRNNISFCDTAVKLLGGSCVGFRNDLFSNDVNYDLSGSLPIFLDGDNSESSFQHLNCPNYGAGGRPNGPIAFRGPRCDTSLTPPGIGYFTTTGTGKVRIEHIVVENFIPSDAYLLAATQHNVFSIDGLRCSTPFALERLGLPLQYVSVKHTDILDRLGEQMFGGGLVSTNIEGGADNSGVRGIVFRNSGSPNNDAAGVWGEANAIAPGTTATAPQVMPPLFPAGHPNAGQAWGAGVVGAIAADAVAKLYNGCYAAFLARLAQLATASDSALKMVGLYVMKPTVANGAVINGAAGVYIEDMVAANVNSPRGFDQYGAEMRNYFRGYNVLSNHNTNGSGFLDAILEAKQHIFHLDEAAGTLRVRVKYADGATVKEGAVPLFATATSTGNRLRANAVSSTNYTPNAALYEVHRIEASGNLTVNAPTGMEDGSVLTLDVKNGAVGAITVTLNGAFRGTFTAPSTGNTTTRSYVYDAVATHWIPVGAQSEEFIR